MSISDILQWIVTAIIALFMAYIAFRKAPFENSNLNGGATKSYAEAAQIAGELVRKYAAEVKALEERLDMVEKKSYRITIEFVLGDPPTVGIVKIEPFIPEKKKG